MSVTFKIDGLKELDAELRKLKNPTARGVGRRAMRKALQPVASMANAFWPGANDQAFIINSRVKRGQPQPVETPTSISMFVGSAQPHAHLLEFGTGPRYTKKNAFRGSVSPLPMLQPAWDANKDGIVQDLRIILGDEIRKTFARIAARASR